MKRTALELVTQAELDLPLSCHRRSDRSKIRYSVLLVGQTKIGVVGQVEELGTELELPFLADLEVFHYR